MKLSSPTLRLALVLALASTAACSAAPPTASSEAPLGAVFLPHKSLRIAVVGAGPSGLTAADTLVQLGYRNVTVFEKNDRVGGKVYSYRNGSTVSELGAVFASPDYSLVLGLADKFGIPYQAYVTTQSILDENGVKQSAQSFLTSRYTTLQILGATVAYGAALTLFAQIQQSGFAWLLPDLDLPFDQFAAKYGFTPIAELVRSVMIGFGYGYYETAPAANFMKLIGWLVKLGGSQGLQQATYYTFPTGYQSIWEAVAQHLDVRLGSTVTAIARRPPLSGGSRVTLTINDRDSYDFDVVIISAPLNRVGSFMSLTDDEQALFSQVQSERYVVSLFAASGLATDEVLFFHGNARPERINHVDVWANRDPANPLYVGYQIAAPELPLAQVTATLADDVAGQGGQFGGALLQKEWDYFPHVSTAAMQAGFYERMEALQGRNNTFYVGSTLSFETVEHSARYARALVQSNFPAPLF
ncbi:MAG TPA: FAD-dependent oxidoreductase [Polyangia bacterium]